MSSGRKVRKFIALTLTLVIVLPLSILAARWQWERHLEKEARNQLVAAAEASPTASLTSLTTSDGQLKANSEWRQVEVSGRYRAGSQRLWRKQPLDGRPGFIVVAVFEPNVGLPFTVDRGWVAADGARPDVDPREYPLPVEGVLVGHLRSLAVCSGPDPGDLPPGQTNCPNTLLSEGAGFRLQATAAPDPLTSLPMPELDPGPHLGYVGQWILIGLTAIITYVALLRRLDEGQANETKSA